MVILIYPQGSSNCAILTKLWWHKHFLPNSSGTYVLEISAYFLQCVNIYISISTGIKKLLMFMFKKYHVCDE